MQVVPLKPESFGKFFNGDAYIVYACSEYGQPGGMMTNNTKKRNSTRMDSSNLEQHIHFWIGEKCSQDEATIAAYKSVELDDLLGGHPIQHREVQGYESSRFKSYFKVKYILATNAPAHRPQYFLHPRAFTRTNFNLEIKNIKVVALCWKKRDARLFANSYA